jgi:cation:H+ antiporter
LLSNFSIPVLGAIFVASSIVVWLAGTSLSKATDVLSTRFHFGEALGGAILLAIATNLPELAITVSAAVSGYMELAVGNILGGIAIQTVVLVLLDRFGMAKNLSLTHQAASLRLVVEGLLVVSVLVIAIMATQLPPTLIAFRLTPGPVMITLSWVLGVWIIGHARRGLTWNDATAPADVKAAKRGDAAGPQGHASAAAAATTSKSILSFSLAAAATLVCGVLLEESGVAIVAQIGMSGVLFGATVLAAATALPEVATGFASMRLGDYQLAVSDILGGNAFLPVLFLIAELISGRAVLPYAQSTDIYLAALGILLTVIYLGGLIFRSKRTVSGIGVDSLLVLVLYVLGMAGLFAIAPGPTNGPP